MRQSPKSFLRLLVAAVALVAGISAAGPVASASAAPAPATSSGTAVQPADWNW